MDIYVINLKHDVFRKNIISASLNKKNINFKLFNGIYGKDLRGAYLHTYFSRSCIDSCPKSVLGCAASHIEIMKKAANSVNEYTIVLEDDATLTERFSTQNIYSLIEEAGDFDLFILGCLHGCGNNDAGIVRMFRSTDYLLNLPLSENIIRPDFFAGTHAMVYTKSGANKILQAIALDHVYNHIDIYLNNLYKHGLINVKATNQILAYQDLSDTNNGTYSLIDSFFAKTLPMQSSFHPYYLHIYELKTTVKLLLLLCFYMKYGIDHKYFYLLVIWLLLW